MGFVLLRFDGRLRVWCCCKTKFLVILGFGCVFLYLGKVCGFSRFGDLFLFSGWCWFVIWLFPGLVVLVVLEFGLG